MARKSKACRVGTVKFKTKRGKTIQFHGHTGAGCAPRKKPSTAHLRHYKNALATAARHCKRKHLKAGAFRNCVSSAMPK